MNSEDNLGWPKVVFNIASLSLFSLLYIFSCALPTHRTHASRLGSCVLSSYMRRILWLTASERQPPRQATLRLCVRHSI